MHARADPANPDARWPHSFASLSSLRSHGGRRAHPRHVLSGQCTSYARVSSGRPSTLAPTPDVPVTQNPYEYGGARPTRITDPSGRS